SDDFSLSRRLIHRLVVRDSGPNDRLFRRTYPMNQLRIAFLFSALFLASSAADAQTPGRVRGTITAIDGNMLSVKSREGQDLKIELAPNATVAHLKALKLAAIAPGTPLGTSAVKGPDGKIVAREL